MIMSTFDYTAGPTVATRARLGVIILQSDETLEHDLRRMIPEDGVGVYASRIPNAPEVSSETLAEMAGVLTHTAGLLPTRTDYDVVGYGCTSGTAVIGADRIAGMIHDGCNTGHVTEPLTALIAACKALNLKKIAFLSPYVEEVSNRLRQRLDDAGIATPLFGSFNEAIESQVARIDGDSVMAAATTLYESGDWDGIFMSCTNLQTLNVIAELEDRCGCPVLSSNLVLAWHMMTLSGLSSHNPQLGSLLRH